MNAHTATAARAWVLPVRQMDPVLTEVELKALDQFIQSAATSLTLLPGDLGAKERERLRVVRRAVQKVHRLNKIMRRSPQAAGSVAV